jgi:hypothetical protein
MGNRLMVVSKRFHDVHIIELRCTLQEAETVMDKAAGERSLREQG